MGYFSGGGAPTAGGRTFFQDDGTPAPVADPAETAAGEAPYSFKAATNKKDLAEALIRLHAAGDTKNFNKIAGSAGSVFTPEDLTKYGLDKFGQGEGAGKSWLDRFKSTAGTAVSLGSSRLGGLEAKGLSLLNRPSQRSLAVLGDLRRGHFGQAAAATLSGAVDALPTGVAQNVGLGDFTAGEQLNQAVPGENDGQRNMRQVLGFKADAGGHGWIGRAVGAADTAGVIATDPLTYASFGGSSLAKAGLKTIGEKFGEDMVAKISQHGLEGAVKKGLITELEHEAIQNALKDQAKALVESAAKKRSVRKLVESQGAEKATQTLGDATYEAVQNSGRSGLRLGVGEAKRTVIPTRPFGLAIPGLQAKYGFSAAGSALDKIAESTAPFDTQAAKESLKAADTILPSIKDAIEHPNGVTQVGDQFYLKNAEGKVAGTLALGVDKDGKPIVDTLFVDKALAPEAHAADKLYQAAADAGHDIANLGADEMTAAGRKAREGFLERSGMAAAPSEIGATTTAPIRRSIGGYLKDTKAGDALRNMFVTRAGTRSAFGASVADKVYGAVEQAAAESGRNINDMMIQVGHISGEAAKEFKGGAGEALTAVMPEIAGRTGKDASNDVLLGVLEGTLDSTAIKDALAKDGMSQSVKAVEAFEDVARQQAEAIARTRGAVPEEAAGLFDAAAPGRGGTLARILTPEAEALAKGGKQQAMTSLFGKAATDLKQGTDMTAALGTLSPQVEKTATNSLGQKIQTLGQDTHALAGRTYADMPIREVNDDLVKRLALPEGTKIFVDDALTGIALRGKSAFQAAAQTDIFERLAEESINGKPLVGILRPSDGVIKTAAFLKMAEEEGWKQLDSGEGKKLALGEVWGPPEIMGDLSKMQDMIVNDASLKQFSAFLNKWNGMWASYATVPVVFGTGFHSRNGIGNVILSFMGGLTNPARFEQAGEVQWGVARTRALMKKEGINFEEALVKQVSNERTRQLITDMRAHGIISNGFFADISGDEVENVLRHNSLKDWMNPKKIPARLNDNQMIRTGRKVGDVVENNARVALYMDAFDKMGSVQAAADHVKKFLFDYQDLTPFERRYMKSANRFYTFTRKNVAVQMYTLAHDPWRIHMANKLEGMLYNGPDSADANLPDYARKGGFNITRLFGKPAGTEGVGMNIDTPWDNAMKTLDPIVQGMSMMPGLKAVVPPDYRSDKGELSKSIVGLRAGGPVEFLNFLMEQATGKDLYSGKDISNEGKGKTFERLANAFVPLYSKGDTFSQSATNPIKLVTGGFGEDPSHPGMTTRLSLMQALVGFQVLPITDKQVNQVAFAGAQEATNALAKLKAEGVDVPTYTDLVALGLAPDLKAKTLGAKKQTSAQTAKARVDQLNAARRATGASPLQVTLPKTKATGPKSYF